MAHGRDHRAFGDFDLNVGVAEIGALAACNHPLSGRKPIVVFVEFQFVGAGIAGNVIQQRIGSEFELFALGVNLRVAQYEEPIDFSAALRRNRKPVGIDGQLADLRGDGDTYRFGRGLVVLHFAHIRR